MDHGADQLVYHEHLQCDGVLMIAERAYAGGSRS